MSTYCGSGYRGTYVPGSGGRAMAKSIYFPNLQRSDTVSASEDATEPVEAVQSPTKIHDPPIREFGEGVAKIKSALPSGPQKKNGFVYSVYANPAFQSGLYDEHATSDEKTPVRDDNYEREHERLQNDADRARRQYEEAKRRLANLEHKHGVSTVSVDEIAAKNTPTFGEAKSTYNFEQLDEKLLNSAPAKPCQIGPVASIYYGLPNDSVLACEKKPVEYHFSPKTVEKSLVKEASEGQTAEALRQGVKFEEPQPAEAKTPKLNKQSYVYSQYHTPILYEQRAYD